MTAKEFIEFVKTMTIIFVGMSPIIFGVIYIACNGDEIFIVPEKNEQN